MNSDLVLKAIGGIIAAYFILPFAGIAVLFLIGACKDWVTDDTTPMDILDRLCGDDKPPEPEPSNVVDIRTRRRR